MAEDRVRHMSWTAWKDLKSHHIPPSAFSCDDLDVNNLRRVAVEMAEHSQFELKMGMAMTNGDIAYNFRYNPTMEPPPYWPDGYYPDLNDPGTVGLILFMCFETMANRRSGGMEAGIVMVWGEAMRNFRRRTKRKPPPGLILGQYWLDLVNDE